MMDSLLDFCDTHSIQYDPKKDKVISRGRVIDIKKKYLEYAEMTRADRLIPITEFSLKVYEALKKQHEHDQNQEDYDDFLYKSVLSVDDCLIQAMEIEGFVLSPNGDQIINERTHVTMRRDDAETLILNHVDRYNDDSKVAGKFIRDIYSVEAAKRAFRARGIRLAQENRAATIKTLKFDERAEEYTMESIDHILKGFFVEEEDLRVYKIVFLQWLWTVKAYMYGYSVKDPILLNFYSPDQGIGKSNAILRITEPFKNFREPDAPLRYAIDPREHHRFGENYVIIFDELLVGGNENEYKQIIAAFKKILTASEINPRELGSQREIKMTRIAAAFSTSNQPLTDTLFDDTGMRRFFEFTFQRPPGSPEGSRNDDLLDWLMKELDPSIFWKGVNEHLTDGYAPPRSEQLALIQEAQKKTNRVVDSVKMILEDDDFLFTPIYTKDYKDFDHVKTYMEDLKRDASAKKMSSDLGFDVIPLPKFRKELVDCMEEEFGRGSGRYVKGIRRFGEDLDRRGVLLLNHQTSIYVACGTMNTVGVGAK